MLYVDPSKTIQAPYCPADVAFGLNLGQMCSNELCILKYHNLKGISYSRDSKQVIHILNQLCCTLSQLTRQSYLLLTGSLTNVILTESDKNYQL